jgi:hypothetical protein
MRRMIAEFARSARPAVRRRVVTPKRKIATSLSANSAPSPPTVMLRS